MTSLVSFGVWAFDEAQLKNFTTYGALLPIIIGLIIDSICTRYTIIWYHY